MNLSSTARTRLLAGGTGFSFALAMILVALLPARDARADEGLYATAAAGFTFGGFDTALAARPYAKYSRSRDAFSPSVEVGWQLTDRIGVALCCRTDGSYAYDYEYGLSPLVFGNGQAGGTVQVTQRLSIRERLSDVAIETPVRALRSGRCLVEFLPGLARERLSVDYSSRSAVLSGGSAAFVDTPVLSEVSESWALGASVRGTFALTRRVSAVAGYGYLHAAHKEVSSLSMGLKGSF